MILSSAFEGLLAFGVAVWSEEFYVLRSAFYPHGVLLCSAKDIKGKTVKVCAVRSNI
jgi:hypothetical protein